MNGFGGDDRFCHLFGDWRSILSIGRVVIRMIQLLEFGCDRKDERNGRTLMK